jgi:nucleoside-diphosphate-sugar epimerase
MKVLVTGGAGYVGGRVAAHLLAGGAEVTVFDALFYGGEALLPFLDHPRFRLVRGDVRNRRALAEAMAGQDAVIHLASIVGEPACTVDEELARAVNLDASIEAIGLAETAGVKRFLFFSTCSNYGVASAETLADEDAELNPLSLYAQTKVEVEKAVLTHAGAMTATVLRLGTICGLGGRMRFDLLISEMARSAVLGDVIEVYKPQAWRPFLHIRDAARAAETILTTDPARVDRRVFNVVADNLRKCDLVDMVRRHFAEVRIEVTEKAPDNRDYRVSGARIERELGFHTEHTIEDAFKDVAEAVCLGVFREPRWVGHSAIPVQGRFVLP